MSDARPHANPGPPPDPNELCPAEDSWRHRFSRSRSPERSLQPPANPDIAGLFDVDRFVFDEKWRLLPFVCWAPLGTVLAVVRVFMCFHVYLAANMLPQPSFIRRFVLRWMWTVMGLVVSVEDDDLEEEEDGTDRDRDRLSLLISNHVCPMDPLAVHLVTESVSPHLSGLPSWFRVAYGWHDFGWREDGESAGTGAEEGAGPRRGAALFCQRMNRFVRGGSSSKCPLPVHVMPEGCRTNGRLGLLRFQAWWVSALGGVADAAEAEAEAEAEEAHDNDNDVPSPSPSANRSSSCTIRDRIGVRPLALSWWRPALPCPARVSTVDSSPWADLFWLFFCPVTFVRIRFLPAVWRTAAQADAEDFASFVAKKIAAGLSASSPGGGRDRPGAADGGSGKAGTRTATASASVVATTYTGRDRDEHVKRLMFEAISSRQGQGQGRGRGQGPRTRTNGATTASYPDEILRMADRVKEIIPAVPLVAIAADLRRTGDLDQTLTNFLDGNVAYTPEDPDPDPDPNAEEATATSKAPQASKSTVKRPPPPPQVLSFPERKALLIEEARRKYLEKHPHLRQVDSAASTSASA